MIINKSKIIRELKDKASEELAKFKKTYDSTRTMANQEDMKAESKWDTRGTEAKYLADGQQRRIEELEQEVALIEQLHFKNYKTEDEVALGAVVEIEFNHISRYYFICSTAGGTILNIDGVPILVISVFSPIGRFTLSQSPVNSSSATTQLQE